MTNLNQPTEIGTGIIQVHDIFDPIPMFMYESDLIFVDVPYNQALLTNYSNRDGVVISSNNNINYIEFRGRLINCIIGINPKTCYIETGKEQLAWYLTSLSKYYKYTTFYNSTYYHKQENKSYVIRASNKPKHPKLDDMDEEDIIKWICANEDYNCIGDLCMGRGLVGLHAYQNNKRFAGTELNYKRLSVLIERIAKSK